jgi:arylsulfatase A-like enzyme/Tfp pilus assembly protein PilF
MRRPRARALPRLALPLLVVLVVSSGGACRRDGPAAGAGGGNEGSGALRFPRAPVVLISIDTLRSDHLPAYGYRGVETPAIDALASDAVLFERAWSHCPLTLPSHLTVLTGQLPGHHGVRDNVGYPFDPDRHPFLPRVFKAAGYATGGAVSSFVLRAETGIGRGFDAYDSALHGGADDRLDTIQRPGTATVAAALAWLRPRAARPFFLFVHLYEPHVPYRPPEPFASRYAGRPYDGEIATADAAVGGLLSELKRLGVYDQAVVALMSDHGEGLGEHGENQHGVFLYRSTLQVPLLVKLPGGRLGGRRVAAPARLADLFPTLVELAGLAVPAGVDGSSLVPLFPGAAPRAGAAAREAYSETYYGRLHFGWSELTSLVGGPGGRFHYIEAPEPELYDLAADPGETRNVLAAERRAYAQLKSDMAPYRTELAPPAPADAETAAKLASLGYLGGGSAHAKGPLPDPKSQRPAMQRIEDALDRMSSGRYDQAVPILERAVAESPGMGDAWQLLARSYTKVGRNGEAADAYERAMKLAGGGPEIALSAAAALLAAGRLDAARQHAEIALRESPQGAYDVLVRVAIARHDEAGAVALMRRAVAAGAASPALRSRLGVHLEDAGEPAEAIAVLAPLAQPADAPALNALGLALSDRGRHEEAMAVLARAVAKDPRDALGYQGLGIVSLRMERPLPAADYLRRALAIDPRLASSWNTLGVALYQIEGQRAGPANALAAWQKAVALDPQQYDALFNIGLVAATAGRREEARRALRRFVATAPPARFGADLAKARGILTELGT